jgi:hypothetical protein
MAQSRFAQHRMGENRRKREKRRAQFLQMCGLRKFAGLGALKRGFFVLLEHLEPALLQALPG